jgi:F-type H+-transporting ATPase subunit delta
MKLSKDGRKLSRQLFRASFTDGRLDGQKVRTIAQAVIAAKPRNYVNVLKDFQRLLRLEDEKRHALIESATPLNSQTSERVLGDLRRRRGQDLVAEFKVNPTLIGGLRIRIGNDVWDGSVGNRLARLEEKLNEV